MYIYCSLIYSISLPLQVDGGGVGLQRCTLCTHCSTYQNYCPWVSPLSLAEVGLVVSIFWLKPLHLTRWRSCRVILYRTLHLGVSFLEGGLSAGGNSIWYCVKGTQDWEFFWLRFWNLRYFFDSHVKILRLYQKKFLIGPSLGEVRFFCVVLGLRGMKTNFELGSKKIFFLLQLWTLNMTHY
jgi:hypothetical protein